MRTHTNSFKEQIKEMGRELDSKITYKINDEEIVLGSEELNAITPSFQGSILKSVMKQIDIDSNIPIPVGTILKYEFGLKVNDEYEYINFGNYIVKDVEKQEDTNSYKITCYDKMLFTMRDYVKMPIIYPITIRDYINSLCLFLGLTFANKNDVFANYDKQIQNELYLDASGNSLGYTFRDVFDELAQVTASTICINDNDELEIRYINETNDSIDEEYFKDINVNFGEKYGPINSIVLSRSAESDNIYLKDDESIEIKIIDNQIMNFNDRDSYLPDIFGKLSGLEYCLNDFSSTGIVYYELCDKYNVSIKENNYPCIMFNNELLITQGLEENIYTEMPENNETDYTKSDKTDRKINQTYLIVDKQNQQIEAVISQTDKQNQKIAQVTQTVEELNSKISDIADITISAEDNDAKLEFENINQSEPIRIVIRPIDENISYLYPRDNLFPSDDLFLKNRILRFTNTKTSEFFDYELPDDLLYYDSENYDEFILDYDGHSCIVNKKIGYNADGTTHILDEIKTIEYDYPTINLTDGNYEISLLGYDRAYIFARLMVQNIYTTQFATKAEVNSEISQTAQEITLSVDKKLSNYSTTTQMNSAIQLSASNITSSVSETYATKNELSTTSKTLNSKIEQTASSITSSVSGTYATKTELGNQEKTINAKLELKVNEAELISEINASADVINLQSNRFIVNSTNLKIAQNGSLTCSDINITGGKLNITNRGQDIIILKDTLNNDTLTINGYLITIKDNNNSNNYSELGEGYLNLRNGSYRNSIYSSDIQLTYGSSYTMITATGGVTHSSREEYKKNIEKRKNNINLIKNCDVYNYLFKEEETKKPHIGLIIGDKYNTPIEVMNEKQDGIEIYNMCGVMWGAIKEQQEIIEQLQNKIEILEVK